MLKTKPISDCFVQQLGRGLRKTDGKEYLTVIDFIASIIITIWYQSPYMVTDLSIRIPFES